VAQPDSSASKKAARKMRISIAIKSNMLAKGGQRNVL
jgi:hypothetical protein